MVHAFRLQYRYTRHRPLRNQYADLLVGYIWDVANCCEAT
jgi:hypothetical protein